MGNRRVPVSHRRLLAAASLAILAVSACQGPAESQQTGQLPRHLVAHGRGTDAAQTTASERSARA